jgi:hypothetical protein
VKIFGYEPAAFAGVLQGVLGVLVVLGTFGLDDVRSTLIQAAAGAAFALVTAIYTKKVQTAVVVGAAQAVLALLVGFGADIDVALQAAIISALQLALAGFLRQTTEAAENPGLHNEAFTSVQLRRVA